MSTFRILPIRNLQQVFFQDCSYLSGLWVQVNLLSVAIEQAKCIFHILL